MTQASTLISEARAYGAGMVSDADAAMQAAISAAQNVGYTIVSYNPLELPEKPEALDKLTAPTLVDITFELPPDPGNSYTFQDISDVVDPGVPKSTAALDSLDTVTKPNQLEKFNEALKEIDYSVFKIDNKLDMTEPPPLDIQDRPEPPAPTYTIPSFEGQRPGGIGNPREDLSIVMATTYHAAAPEFITMVNGYVDAELIKLNPQYHAQLTRIEAQITKYLDGGTGLNPAVEDAIYARARSKNDAEARRVRDQALADAATRGFTIPTGALLSATQQARQAGADNNATAAREIVVMQAEMEQKNLQFAVTTSAALRNAAVSATLSYMQGLVTINGQAADYAKSIVNALVETYNAIVRVYTAKLEGYKADAQVLQARMQAALGEVEIYKAEVQALQAMTQVDMAKVSVYKARIDLLQAKAAVYKTQIDGVVSRASIEKLKVEVFQAQVQAYGAQVNSKTAEWHGYVAAISGNKAKVEAYAAEVQAYNSEVQGYKAGIEAQGVVIEAQAKTNDARAKQFVAQWEGYKTLVASKGDVARTKLENQRQEIVAFQAEASAAVAKYQANTEFYKATAEIGIKNGQLSVEAMLKSAELKQSYGRTIASLNQANATVHANLAGAAMAGMNALAVETATE